jgi:hypothetical protein
MAQVVDERPYSGGLDLDGDERIIKPGDYVYGKNGRSGTSDKNYKGSAEGVRGNVLRNTLTQPFPFPNIPYPFPTGTNKVIGSIEDVKYQTIIYFLWNSTGQHRIIRYYLKEKLLRNVIPLTWATSTILNFQRYSKIWNGKIVYAGEQDYIIWTDGVNPIRKLRLDVGTAYQSLGITALDSQLIDFAKQPPQLPPTLSIVSSSVNTFTSGRGFQFALRYVYDDNSITTLSPYSDIQFVNDTNRAIRVSFSSGHFTVKEIQVLAREGNGVSGEGNSNPTWYIVGKIPRVKPPASSTTYTFDFTNTELKEPIARIDSDKLFESVPELAGCMELSETNQLITLDITEGKDNPAISNDTNGITVTNLVRRTPIGIVDIAYNGSIDRQVINDPVIGTLYPFIFTTVSQDEINLSTDRKKILPDPLLQVPYLSIVSGRIGIEITRDAGAPVSNYRVRLLKNNSLAKEYNFSSASVNQYFVITVNENITLEKGDTITADVQRISGGTGADQIIISPLDDPNPKFINIDGQSFVSEKCLKENSETFIGIQYYDKELRSGGIIPIISPKVTSLNNASPVPIIDYDNPYIPYQRVNIHNRPPEWAHYYSLCIKETNINYGWVRSNSTGVTPIGVTITYTELPRGFDIEVGMRVRFIGQFLPTFTPQTFTPFPSSLYREYSIVSHDTTTKTIQLDGYLEFEFAASLRPIIVEIYNQKAAVPFYFEERFLPVGNPGASNRFHNLPSPASGEQAQSASNPTVTPAQVFMFGNNYTRLFSNFMMYSKYYSNAYESDYWDRGRPAIEITNGGRKRLINGIRWGGQLFPNTLVNNMSAFDAGNYASTNQAFGVINAARLRGYTLRIFQESNTSSAYLNRRNITNADGSDQLVLTDSLITQINPSQQYYGTIHKGSVIMYGDDIYFFDAINGIMVRDAENGQMPISNYGAQKYFRDLAELGRTLGDNHDIICGFDEKTQQLFVSLVEHTDSYTNKSQTISFYEAENRWKFFHDHAVTVGNNQQPIEMYSKMGNNMFMFLNGRCWESNELVDGNGNPVYLKLFGEDREFVLTGVSNIEPVKVKIFLAHSIHTNRTPNFVLIKTPTSAMYPLGMESELLPANYALREGVYYADIKRDAFTKGTPANPTQRKEQIAGGRPIRGNSMTYQMSWGGNDYVVLFTSGVTVIPSEKS